MMVMVFDETFHNTNERQLLGNVPQNLKSLEIIMLFI